MKEVNANFYPQLSEEAAKEAEQLIEDFKAKLTKAADEAISSLYCYMIPHIESDSWSNFRNELICGFKDYDNKKLSPYDFKAIRKQIFEDFKPEILCDLNKDIVEENEMLKKQIEHLNEIHINSRMQ